MILTIRYPEGKGNSFDMFRYPGGEVQVRLTEYMTGLLKSEAVTGVRVVARIKDGEIVALAQLLSAIKSTTSVDIQLILPYLPYARADRRFVPGDAHGLQVFGQLLNQISYDIVTLDVHSEASARYIRHLTNVSPIPIINSVIDILDGTADTETTLITPAILLPDKGSLDRYKDIGGGFLHCDKVRDPETGKLSGFKVPAPEEFKADNILIVDDICDGGATFVGIADALRASGNDLPLYLYVTHGIFSKGYFELLKRFKRIYTTDSISHIGLPEGVYNGLTVLPCMPTILDEIQKRK